MLGRRIVCVGLCSLAPFTVLAPSPADAQSLRIHTAEQVYGPFQLSGGQLQQMPAGVQPVEFEEATWLVGYTTEILDTEGKAMPREMHCHTMMMNHMGMPSSHHEMNAHPFRGVYSDGYTPSIRLPRGFGIYFEAGETLELIPMFNNRDGDPVQASMRVQAHFARDSELIEPLTPLYSTIQVAATPHLYYVDPGKDVKEQEFTMPYPGRIHAMGVHIHPYGRSVELIDLETQKSVWNSVGEVGEDGRLIRMPFYSDEEGYAFEPGQRFLIRATYDNVTDQKQDAMAGLFIFFSTPDGKAPTGQTAGHGAQGHHEHGQHSDHSGHSGTNG